MQREPGRIKPGESHRVEGAFVDTITRLDAATELRYALEVMDEYSHLGLDDDYASKLRVILLKRIDEAEAALSVEPAHPVRFGVSTTISQ